nr:immunoglobulin heavy chain junction region [Mus musculus]MBK4196569.1 immunoglobulin heavy chain junction region [Mus musculus]
CAVYSNSFAYW